MKSLHLCVFAANFLLLLCLHTLSELVTPGALMATGIDWWKNKH